MKNFFLLFCLLMLQHTSFGQIRAVTGSGDEVLLNADGTWKYISEPVENMSATDTNKTSFSKSVNSAFLVKSNKVNFGIYIDSKKWSFSKSGIEEDSEFDFNFKGEDAYGMILSEKTEIPLETLGSIAYENARNVAPDITIARQEYRKVNGNIVLLIEMHGTLKGIKITYLGYYCSSSEGSIQLITYTATKLFEKYKSDLEQFLNGFVRLEK